MPERTEQGVAEEEVLREMSNKIKLALVILLLSSGCAKKEKEYEYKCCTITEDRISCVEYSCENTHSNPLENMEDIKSRCDFCPTAEAEYQHWKKNRKE